MKAGLIGLAVLAVAGIAVAQAAPSGQATLSAADRVLLLQAKRFEGTYKLSSGETKIKVNENDATIAIDSGANKLKAALAPQPGKPSRATFDLNGKTIDGKANIEGKTLTLEFVDGKITYKFKITLTGRNEGELSVMKGDQTLVSGPLKRA